MKEFLKKHGQVLFNIYLFLNFAGFGMYQAQQYYVKNALGYVEAGFIAQSLIVGCIILLRKPFRSFDTNLFDQAIALIAFFSGAAFMGQDATGGETAEQISRFFVFFAHVLGLVTVFNLGRSFGILIAFREIKTQGLYAIIRHPMYGTDILLRIGFLISHLSRFTVVVFLVSVACYIYRAILEERFLRQQAEYQEYMQRVQYRFIPLIF